MVGAPIADLIVLSLACASLPRSVVSSTMSLLVGGFGAAGVRAVRRVVVPRSRTIDTRGAAMAAATAGITRANPIASVPSSAPVGSVQPRRSFFGASQADPTPLPWHSYRKPIELRPTPNVPRLVPADIVRPPYARDDVQADPRDSQYELRGIEIKDAAAIAGMRAACEQASYIRAYAGSCVVVGRTTDEIDAMVHAEVCRLGSYPSPLGYAKFPKSICTSVNQVVVHGIPDRRKLEEGDIINIDVSVYDKSGFHGDCSGMVSGTHTRPRGASLRLSSASCFT